MAALIGLEAAKELGPLRFGQIIGQLVRVAKRLTGANSHAQLRGEVVEMNCAPGFVDFAGLEGWGEIDESRAGLHTQSLAIYVGV
jgi:hypothetical protein